MAKSGIHIALVHYPVTNKRRDRVASAVTNLDVHDFARLACTYGVGLSFVTPLLMQQRFVERIRDHWIRGGGLGYNQDRATAMNEVSIDPSVESLVERLKSETRDEVCVITTSAQETAPLSRLRFSDVAERFSDFSGTVLILFGTGWGLEKSILESSDYLLEPIDPGTGYNHLSVRTAAAIIVDRFVSGLSAGIRREDVDHSSDVLATA